MPRLKLIVAYTGSGFCGWQFQPGMRTVQGCLEDVLSRVCGQGVRVHGSGRTDSGVHALGQVAHVDVPESKSNLDWQKVFNALLPPDVAVLSAERVADSFHARYQVRVKEYRYHLWVESRYVLPQRRPFVWPVGPLGLDKLRAGIRVLQGRHDFAAFQNQGTAVKTTVREVKSIECFSVSNPESPGHDSEVIISFVATGFLKQMVRNMVAALVQVGKSRLDLPGLQAILASKDRTRAPATAPAQGLCLYRVWY